MKKILFIEDEQALQKAVGEVLEQEGFRIFSALDGEVGLDIARKEKPNLILLDLVLPKKDGFEVLTMLKQDKRTKDIPVMVVTNLEDASDIERVLEIGATTYLVKANYSLKDIVDKIKGLLQDK